LQATPWPQSYKPPQLPMYDSHTDPKQFLMSYEATISSYGGNTTVMAKSFVMAVRSVAQTWYSSLRPGTITSWQKLKDMLITSFQGFQTKPVTAQALFQCTQDHEEYLQAYVRRFLRLRAQAPTVPNEIVIEAMIKGLRPGPSAQYFARKPPQTLEKLLQKMDEYVGNHPAASVASASQPQASWQQPPPPPPIQRGQHPEGSQHNHLQRDFREESKARTVNSIVPESKHIY
jgi:hypothetical protein